VSHGHARHEGVGCGCGDLPGGAEIGSRWLACDRAVRCRDHPHQRREAMRADDGNPGGTSGVHRDGVRGAVGRLGVGGGV
jgi:hypothetical protein